MVTSLQVRPSEVDILGMPKFLIGKKNIMTRQFAADGKQIPVTVVEATPCVVVALRSKDKNGYEAVQLGSGAGKRTAKSVAGQFKDLGKFTAVHEFRVEAVKDYQLGQKLDVTQFVVGDKVKVVGVSKGKGFQGVVKRHGFHGSPASHGHKDQLRMPGSIGAGGVQRVFKGLRMAGRMGADKTSVLNLEVVAIKPELNQIWLKGAVPGAIRSKLFIESL
ncbi:MAG: 50S ribosomal protein L3 [Parcubacteria group bacterium GW2011_GWA2_46_39]|nr:MAG: 50S ribosomal protein L3 [Parcubacteria group bacterium GW2011_GWA2_46_39]